MNKWEKDINNLMIVFGQRTRATPDHPPVSLKEINLRVSLIEEESKELTEAILEGYLPHIAKEICDLIVVTIGTARTYGLDLSPIWNAVQDSNMAKINGPIDPITGKILKPEGWEKPNISKLIKEQGWPFLKKG